MLIAQILPASTYPLDIVQAARWVAANPEGAKSDEQINAQPWDASVKALCRFPDVLKMMDKDVAWTQGLGEAFLAQGEDVMSTIQDLHTTAQQAGDAPDHAAAAGGRGERDDPDVPPRPRSIYVPQYNPQTAYMPPPSGSSSVVYSDPSYYGSSAVGKVAPVDTVHIKVHDLADLEKNLKLAKILGYEGMLVLHPKEIELVHRYFSPTDQEITEAREMLKLAEEAGKEGKGVAVMNNKFVGPPMVLAAKTVLRKLDLIKDQQKIRGSL